MITATRVWAEIEGQGAFFDACVLCIEEFRGQKHYSEKFKRLGSGLIPGGKASDKEIQMKINPMKITRFLRKCIITVIGNVIRMPFFDKITQDTRSRTAILANEVICDHHPLSCARRLHLQNNFWERRTSIVRKTLTPRPGTRDGTRDVKVVEIASGNSW